MRIWAALSTLLILAERSHATGHGRLEVDQSLSYLLRLTSSSRPEHTDAAFDCSWRRLAAEYAPTIQPRFSTPLYAKRLHDALQLESLCGEKFQPGAAPDAAVAATVTVTQCLTKIHRSLEKRAAF